MVTMDDSEALKTPLDLSYRAAHLWQIHNALHYITFVGGQCHLAAVCFGHSFPIQIRVTCTVR